MERPGHAPGLHVICADIAGWRPELLARHRAQDDQVLEHAPRILALDIPDALWIAIQSLAEIHPAVLAEGIDGDARLGIDLL